MSVAVCDGDTPQHERARIQYAAELGAPNIILTNPDMLHCTLLPDVSAPFLLVAPFLFVYRCSPTHFPCMQHRNWKRVYENIKFVVVDEAHMYR